MFTGDTFLNGTVDEFRIYYGALTASQVATNFAAGPDVVVPILQPPAMDAVLSGANVVLSWPDSAIGFGLESTAVLGATANWLPVAGTPTDINGRFTVTIPTAGAPKFFRLRK